MTLAEKYQKLVERGMPEPDGFGWSVEWQRFFVVTRFENELQAILLFNESHAEAIITVAALGWIVSNGAYPALNDTGKRKLWGIYYDLSGVAAREESLLDAILAATDE